MQTKPSALHIIWSMIAAFCGIQNNANHDIDNDYIEEAGLWPYILAGVGMTIVFAASLSLIVKLIISQ
jgi:hypothetical protein